MINSISNQILLHLFVAYSIHYFNHHILGVEYLNTLLKKNKPQFFFKDFVKKNYIIHLKLC